MAAFWAPDGAAGCVAVVQVPLPTPGVALAGSATRARPLAEPMAVTRIRRSRMINLLSCPTDFVRAPAPVPPICLNIPICRNSNLDLTRPRHHVPGHLAPSGQRGPVTDPRHAGEVRDDPGGHTVIPL